MCDFSTQPNLDHCCQLLLSSPSIVSSWRRNSWETHLTASYSPHVAQSLSWPPCFATPLLQQLQAYIFGTCNTFVMSALSCHTHLRYHCLQYKRHRKWSPIVRYATKSLISSFIFTSSCGFLHFLLFVECCCMHHYKKPTREWFLGSLFILPISMVC